MISTSVLKTAAALTSSLYGRPGSVDVTWAHRSDAPICWAVVRIGGLWYIVFRGSVTRDDWLHDFEALAIWTPILQAHVHPGFYDGVQDIFNEAMTVIGKDQYVVCGHSLGAARAAIASAYGIVGNKPPLARVSWGEPRPGFADLARLLAAIPNYNFVNGDGRDYDRVTDVPFTLAGLGQWYCAGAPHLFVNEPPVTSADILFAYHNFALYAAAMNKLPTGDM